MYLVIKWMTAVISNRSKEKRFHCLNYTHLWHTQSLVCVASATWGLSLSGNLPPKIHIFSFQAFCFLHFLPSSCNLSWVKSAHAELPWRFFVLTLIFMCTWHIQWYGKLSLSHCVCLKKLAFHSCLTSLTVFIEQFVMNLQITVVMQNFLSIPSQVHFPTPPPQPRLASWLPWPSDSHAGLFEHSSITRLGPWFQLHRTASSLCPS